MRLLAALPLLLPLLAACGEKPPPPSNHALPSDASTAEELAAVGAEYEAWRATLPTELPAFRSPFECAYKIRFEGEDGFEGVLHGTGQIDYRDAETIRIFLDVEFHVTVESPEVRRQATLASELTMVFAEERASVWGKFSMADGVRDPWEDDFAGSVSLSKIQHYMESIVEMNSTLGVEVSAGYKRFLKQPIGVWLHPVTFSESAAEAAQLVAFESAGDEVHCRIRTDPAILDSMESAESADPQMRELWSRMAKAMRGLVFEMALDRKTGFPRPVEMKFEIPDLEVADYQGDAFVQVSMGLTGKDLTPSFPPALFEVPDDREFQDLDPFVDMMIAMMPMMAEQMYGAAEDEDL